MILSQKEQNKTSIYYIASFEACPGYIDRRCFIKTNGVIRVKIIPSYWWDVVLRSKGEIVSIEFVLQVYKVCKDNFSY
jgi:hypothetical protein